jgi:hypothetical protein
MRVSHLRLKVAFAEVPLRDDPLGAAVSTLPQLQLLQLMRRAAPHCVPRRCNAAVVLREFARVRV